MTPVELKVGDRVQLDKVFVDEANLLQPELKSAVGTVIDFDYGGTVACVIFNPPIIGIRRWYCNNLRKVT